MSKRLILVAVVSSFLSCALFAFLAFFDQAALSSHFNIAAAWSSTFGKAPQLIILAVCLFYFYSQAQLKRAKLTYTFTLLISALSVVVVMGMFGALWFPQQSSSVFLSQLSSWVIVAIIGFVCLSAGTLFQTNMLMRYNKWLQRTK